MTANVFSQGLRTRTSYIAEATWATVPATPAMSVVSVRKNTLAYTTTEIKDTSIRSDRMQRYSITGNKNIAGDLEFAYYATTTTSPVDDLLASVLRGSWVSNQLIVGTAETSFVVGVDNLDTSLARYYTGVKPGKTKLAFTDKDGLVATFTCTGHDMLEVAPTGATYSAEPVATPMMHFNGTFNEGGAACAYITGLTIDIDPGDSANYALGDQYAKSITPGMLQVTVTGTAYFPDHTLLDKFKGGTASSMSASVGDGTHTRTFTLPNIKYTAVGPTLTNSGPVIQNFSATGLYDGTSGSVLVVART